MLSYMARQSVFFYPLSVAALVVAAGYCAVTGRWGLVAGIVMLAVFSWFQHLIAQGWIRAGEDKDISEWLRQNPDYEPDSDGSVPE
ncbi:hypothetical protein [Aeromicrobium yanjiei]|uniref:Uncharacterized protein n=1 Tax=Aeromicrobium yanjiei TaxID=2662028 RepID=A0A5Q2MCZ8_9ACTN|nr:hypothetical protein [Aeromicrobium yanjiei]QGG40977.1 hypothetical protein GEV26_06170 [Aeromicrobium yanjiei]